MGQVYLICWVLRLSTSITKDALKDVRPWLDRLYFANLNQLYVITVTRAARDHGYELSKSEIDTIAGREKAKVEQAIQDVRDSNEWHVVFKAARRYGSIDGTNLDLDTKVAEDDIASLLFASMDMDTPSSDYSLPAFDASSRNGSSPVMNPASIDDWRRPRVADDDDDEEEQEEVAAIPSMWERDDAAHLQRIPLTPTSPAHAGVRERQPSGAKSGALRPERTPDVFSRPPAWYRPAAPPLTRFQEARPRAGGRRLFSGIHGSAVDEQRSPPPTLSRRLPALLGQPQPSVNGTKRKSSIVNPTTGQLRGGTITDWDEHGQGVEYPADELGRRGGVARRVRSSASPREVPGRRRSTIQWSPEPPESTYFDKTQAPYRIQPATRPRRRSSVSPSILRRSSQSPQASPKSRILSPVRKMPTPPPTPFHTGVRRSGRARKRRRFLGSPISSLDMSRVSLRDLDGFEDLDEDLDDVEEDVEEDVEDDNSDVEAATAPNTAKTNRAMTVKKRSVHRQRKREATPERAYRDDGPEEPSSPEPSPVLRKARKRMAADAPESAFKPGNVDETESPVEGSRKRRKVVDAKAAPKTKSASQTAGKGKKGVRETVVDVVGRTSLVWMLLIDSHAACQPSGRAREDDEVGSTPRVMHANGFSRPGDLAVARSSLGVLSPARGTRSRPSAEQSYEHVTAMASIEGGDDYEDGDGARHVHFAGSPHSPERTSPYLRFIDDRQARETRHPRVGHGAHRDLRENASVARGRRASAEEMERMRRSSAPPPERALVEKNERARTASEERRSRANDRWLRVCGCVGRALRLRIL